MTEPKGNASRRDFLKVSSAATVAGLGFVPTVHAAGKQTIKVGLIGCGGRGTGAVENICEAAGTSHDIKIVAMADAFEDHAKTCHERLKNSDVTKGKFEVPTDAVFWGFDGYQKVIDASDLVILATPPGFRPQHIEATIKAGKHLFTEKPVAVDGPGIRKVLAAAKEAQAKNLAVVAGTQRRHQAGYLESMKRIHEGALGDLTFARVFWNQGNIWAKKRNEGWSDMEYQVRNWYHYTWLCGDHIVEQHVHNLDVAIWALKGLPVRCLGMGGQQVNREPEFGESFDHFAVDYEFPNNIHVISMARQIAGCDSDVSEYIYGTKGNAHLMPGRYDFNGEGLSRLRVRDEVNPYVQEHIDLLESIAAGKPLNELETVAHSTLAAIMGRMSAYTGKEVSWEQALNSQLNTFPEKLEWGPYPTQPVAKPGSTPLI